MALLYCLSQRCSISHRPHYIAEDTSAHPGDQSLTTIRRLGSHALQDTGPCRLWDPAYVAPPILVVNDARGLVGTQAPSLELYLVQGRD